MESIKLYEKDIHTGSLVLVNRSYPVIDRDKNKIQLAPMNERHQKILLEIRTANVLNYMMKDINCEADIVPVSGYRSFNEQQDIYQDSILENGIGFTKDFVAVPGHSEHQTGLAIDLARKQENIDFICPDFPYKGICDYFRRKAPEYGFVQRYKKDKESITGIAHEPWHFRYVGYPHSQIMNNLNLSLEEYIENIKEYPHDERYFNHESNGKIMKVSYVDISSYEYKTIELPEKTSYMVSGNNVDGFIITTWRED